MLSESELEPVFLYCPTNGGELCLPQQPKDSSILKNNKNSKNIYKISLKGKKIE